MPHYSDSDTVQAPLMSIAQSCKIGVKTNGLRSRNTVVVPSRHRLQSVSSWGLNVRDVARIDAVERLAALASLRSLEIYDAFAELVGQAGAANDVYAERFDEWRDF